MNNSTRIRFLYWITWINIILHFFGLGVALFFLRPGSPSVELEARLSYLTQHSLAWSLSWGLWMVCALALLCFMTTLYTFIPKNGAFFVLIAVVFTSAGIAIDLVCEVISIRILPFLAKHSQAPHTLFLAFERLTNAGGVIVANGLYCLAVLFATWGTTSVLSKNIRGICWTGYGTFVFGMGMVAAGFLGHSFLLELSTGPTIASFMLWTYLVGKRFWSEEEISL